jgi:hypothetical protein
MKMKKLIIAILITFTADLSAQSWITKWKTKAMLDSGGHQNISVTGRKDGTLYVLQHLFSTKSKALSSIRKYNNEGALLWEKEYDFRIEHLQVNDAGLFALTNFTGSINVGPNVYTSEGNYDILLLQFDTNGEISKSKRIGADGMQFAQGFFADDAHLSVFLTYEHNLTVDKEELSDNGGSLNAAIIEFDHLFNAERSYVIKANTASAAFHALCLRTNFYRFIDDEFFRTLSLPPG